MMTKAELMSLLAMVSENDRLIYGAIARAAASGLPCPTSEDLVEITSYTALSSTVDSIHRLERLGVLAEVLRYQRGRQVRIAETGEWTALPLNRAPHWRTRPPRVPSPAPAALKARNLDVFADIEKWAARRGVTLADALADLVFVGFMVEMERG